MSIYADPSYVRAEVDYRREAFAAGLPAVRTGGRHHAATVRAALRGLRGGRHTSRSHHGRHTARTA